MNKTQKNILDIVEYLIVFILIMYVVDSLVNAGSMLSRGYSMGDVWKVLQHGALDSDSVTIIVSSVISSVLTIAWFAWRKWTPLSRGYVASRPWTALVWVALLTIGTILPSLWLQDQFNFSMPSSTMKLLAGVMSQPVGYLAVGVLAPVAEEMVFRGAILRTLLKLFDNRWHWIAILISALLFGLIHGNDAQFVHALLIGLLLGWTYYRTDSIIPGIVLHWVNNTVAYVAFNLMPGIQDMKFIDLCQGSHTKMLIYLGSSLCILLPSLFQLSFRLKKNN